MKISPASLQTAPQAKGTTFDVAGGDAWAKSLTVGQLLKARVLRQVGEGRYQLSFGGSERVVDSAVPLNVGDVLHGRVVGVGDKVVVERLPVRAIEATHHEPERTPNPVRSSGAESGSLVQLARQRQIALSDAQAQIIKDAFAGFPEARVIEAGLYLAKIGLPITRELVRSLAERLISASAGWSDRGSVLHLISKNETLSRGDQRTEANQHDTESAISAWLAQPPVLADEPASCDAPDQVSAPKDATEGLRTESGDASGADGDRDAPEEKLMRATMQAILSVQAGGAIKHALRTLPVVVDDRLLELDVALFDHGLSPESGHTKLKRIAMVLDTASGPIRLDASIVENRLRLDFRTESNALLECLEDNAPTLAARLTGHGWALDTTNYQLGKPEQTAAGAVVSHVLEQDSLALEV